MDAWLDAVDGLAPGNHSVRTFPADRPYVHTSGPSGEVIIRQWPEDAMADEIRYQASVRDAVHSAIGDMVPTIDRVPGSDDTRFLIVKDRLYTRSPHLDGFPLGRYGGFQTPDGRAIDIPLPESANAHAVIAQLAELIARCHTATEDLAANDQHHVWTLEMFLDDVRRTWFNRRKTLGERAAEQRDIRRWLRCGNRIIPTSSDLLRNESRLMTDQSVINHRDLWPVNILVEGRDEQRAIVGIVGWRHASAGSPVLDVAALTTHMQGWSAALTEAIIESYSMTRRLLPEERRLIPAVASLDLVTRVSDLLVLAYLDDSMIGHPSMPALRSGMKTLLNSLETLTRILAPDIEQTNRFSRQRSGRPPIGGGPRRVGGGRGYRRDGGSGKRNTRPRSEKN